MALLGSVKVKGASLVSLAAKFLTATGGVRALVNFAMFVFPVSKEVKESYALPCYAVGNR